MMRSERAVRTMGGLLAASLLLAAPKAWATENSAESADAALECLTTAIAYEAGFEPRAGQEAVAEVILNRTRSGFYPRTVCGVVYQGSTRRTGCQFSFTCDGSLRRALPARVLSASRAVAAAAIADMGLPDSGRRHTAGATHYHADYVSPYWAPTLTRVTKIGAHIFYRMRGVEGGPLVPAAAPRLAQGADTVPVAAAATVPARFSPWGLASD